MPTGTVSGGSNGSRTFPVREESRTEPRDASGDAEQNARTGDPGARTDEPSARTAELSARTDGHGDVPSLRREVTRLRRENEELRRTLRETRDQRQDVIDRYERLIDADGAAPSDAAASAETPSPEELARAPPESRTSSDSTTPVFRRLAETLDEQWTRLRRRYKAWERQSGL
jgi:chromosome segregation ATPase